MFTWWSWRYSSYLWQVHFAHSLLLSLSLFLATMRWKALLHYPSIAMTFCLHTALRGRDKSLQIEASETINENKTFVLIVMSGILSQWQKPHSHWHTDINTGLRGKRSSLALTSPMNISLCGLLVAQTWRCDVKQKNKESQSVEEEDVSAIPQLPMISIWVYFSFYLLLCWFSASLWDIFIIFIWYLMTLLYYKRQLWNHSSQPQPSGQELAAAWERSVQCWIWSEDEKQ